MFPAPLIDIVAGCDDAVLPRYLTERDLPWVRTLQDTFEACVGRPRREVERQIARLRLPGARRKQRFAMAAQAEVVVRQG